MQTPQLADALTDLTLHQAWSKVYENQGCAGVDGQTLMAFAEHLLVNLDTLRNEVRYGTYRPQPLLRVAIDKPSGGKRLLSIPCVRDRILQTAVTLVIEPVFEAEFEDCSFAYRKGRSVDQAVARVQALQRQGYQWVVDADIQAFFDNIDHTLLLVEIGKLITDQTLLQLIQQWLKATVFDNGQPFELHKGVPQGSPIAPLLANLYLHHLDETLLEDNACIVRFADDFLVLCKSQDRAEQVLELTDDLLSRLRLTLNTQKTRVVHFDQGFRFLGVQFIRSLAFKTEADPPNEITQSLSAVQPPPIQTDQNVPQTPMQLAFAEAKLKADDFPHREIPLENLDIPDEADLPADSEPLLRTLYLLQHGQVLGKESERLIVRQEHTVVREIPAIKVDQVMVFGNAQITTQAMHFCLQERIPIYLLSGQGSYYGVIDSFSTEPVLLHREQFLRADDPDFCLAMAKAIVHGKLANSRLLLQRVSRRHEHEALTTAAASIKKTLASLNQATTLDELRGYEGSAANSYFQALAVSIDPNWGFTRRVRQPPTDGINALLSYGYTLLFYNIYSLLRSRGLNPHVGFLHALRQGHPALASDIMEEFRALVVDAVVWNLAINQRRTLPAQTARPASVHQSLGRKAQRAHHPSADRHHPRLSALHGIPSAAPFPSHPRLAIRIPSNGAKMTRLWLVSYDISDNKIRRHVYKLLKDYGKRVQYSVFECHLTDQQQAVLRTLLLAQIDSDDSLRWYPLCVWCSDSVFFQGEGLPPDDEDYFLQ